MSAGSAGARRAQIVGTGLIGGSVALGLRAQGWHVSGLDIEEGRVAEALRLGVIDDVGLDPEAEICVVAAPVGQIAALVTEMLAVTNAVVTDVGSVKAPVVAAVHHPRFIGGHPMAGSEQEGVAASRADMFQGAVWVLTPDAHTDPAAFTLVHRVVASLGADVVTLDPTDHDDVVATVSHVPHLAAVTLMSLAASRSAERSTLLRLAAGGFRDMTRIAAGSPDIWPDICAENRSAIVSVLDEFIDELGEVRDIVAEGRTEALLEQLTDARAARRNLPSTAGAPESMSEVRVRIPDLPGQIEAVARCANAVGANIYDIEIAHSAEGEGGVLIALVSSVSAPEFRDALDRAGYSASIGSVG